MGIPDPTEYASESFQVKTIVGTAYKAAPAVGPILQAICLDDIAFRLLRLHDNEFLGKHSRIVQQARPTTCTDDSTNIIYGSFYSTVPPAQYTVEPAQHTVAP